MLPDQAWAALLASGLAPADAASGSYVRAKACIVHGDGSTDYAAWFTGRNDGLVRVASFRIDASGAVAANPAPWAELEGRAPAAVCEDARKRRCRNDIAQRGIEALWAAARSGAALVNVAGPQAPTLPARYVDYLCRFHRVCSSNGLTRRRIRYSIKDDRGRTYTLSLGMDTNKDGKDKAWIHYRLIEPTPARPSAPAPTGFPGLLLAAGVRPYGSNWQCRAAVCAIDRPLTIASNGRAMRLAMPLAEWSRQVTGAINSQIGGNCYKRTTPFVGAPRKICVHVVIRGPGAAGLAIGQSANFPWPIPGWSSSQICAIPGKAESGSVVAEVRLYTKDWSRATAVADVPYAPAEGTKDPGYVISKVLDKFAVVALDGATHVGWGVGNVQMT